jgi:Transposase DDE domain
MHAPMIVARVLGDCVGWMHKKRGAALQRAVVALLFGGVATLSAIALRMAGPTHMKHRIKSMDRLLGNVGLQREREALYVELSRRWLAGLAQVLLVVDWSDLTRDQRWQWLRASVVVEGRSVTLYEEVHPQRLLANRKVHERFVQRLSAMLPSGCGVIVMTDAGFHAPWFRLLERQGWQFIGRIRGRNRVQVGGARDWLPARALYARASTSARDLGCGYYARSNPVDVRLVLAKRLTKSRHRLNIYGAKRAGRSSARSARSAREPWLLATSLGLQHLAGEAIVSLYAQRMQIEQSFRDAKSSRVGFGLERARSRSGARLQMLLLFVHLATFVQRLIGECAKERQLALDFMSRRRAHRPEISALTLGRRIINAATRLTDQLQPWLAPPLLTAQAARAAQVRP